jgi:hypothetical protein
VFCFLSLCYQLFNIYFSGLFLTLICNFSLALSLFQSGFWVAFSLSLFCLVLFSLLFLSCFINLFLTFCLYAFSLFFLYLLLTLYWFFSLNLFSYLFPFYCFLFAFFNLLLFSLVICGLLLLNRLFLLRDALRVQVILEITNSVILFENIF